MEPAPPSTLIDDWGALKNQLERGHRRSTPRGELTQDELYDFAQRLGQAMYRARLRAGLTQDQVAAMMDTTRSVVSRIERMSSHLPSLTTLCRYANAIDCTVRIDLVPRGPSPIWWDE